MSACRWCGLAADTAPSISMNGIDREHSTRSRLSDGCVDAMLAELKALRERVDHLENRLASVEGGLGAVDARTIGMTMLGGLDGH